MKTYEMKITVKLDDDGYLLKNNWIYDAIQQQINYESVNEKIVSFKIREIKNLEYTTPKFEPAIEEAQNQLLNIMGGYYYPSTYLSMQHLLGGFKMKIYRIMCSQTTDYAVNIEAENEQDAIEISNNLDFCMFTELPETDWQIEDIRVADDSMIQHYITVTKEETL